MTGNRTSFALKAAVLAICFLLGRLNFATADDRPSGQVSAETVKKAQSELKEKGYYDGPVDGVLGTQTRSALQHFQEKKGLNADGRLTQETAVQLGTAEKGDKTPGEHFEGAGKEIKGSYGKGGKDLGHGTKEAGKDIKEGEVTEAGKDFGKGAGKFGKEVGKGTGKAAKKVGKGVKDAVDPNDDDKEKKEKDSKH
jgi:peptidoglycan hydrolase-like protein with peptidoglycan-binding domain